MQPCTGDSNDLRSQPVFHVGPDPSHEITWGIAAVAPGSHSEPHYELIFLANEISNYLWGCAQTKAQEST